MNENPVETLRRALERAAQSGQLEAAIGATREFLAARGESELWERVATAVPSAKGAAPAERFGIIGASPVMLAVFDKLEKMIPSAFPVLIYGESGTGKELIAKALHEYGPRKSNPFLSTNCAAIPETLLEAELFGHKKGSFTGAVNDRKGHFVAADGGTLFLDEIADMSPGMQSKLLRVLEDHEVRPVGSNESRKVDVRVVAASNKRLQDLVAAGKFRQDLFFRLHVLSLDLPPLRERREDIPRLTEFLCAKVGKEMRKSVELTPAAVTRLQAHSWPGNVRELENEIRRAAALTSGRIDAKDLRPELP